MIVRCFWLPGPSLLLFWDGVCSSGGGWWLRNLVGSRQARAQTDVAGQLYLRWLRQGSAPVQDLTSPIAPKAPTANFRIRSGAPHRTRKRVHHPSACVCLLRIHPAQPRRWETVRYAPLACTKRRYRLVPSRKPDAAIASLGVEAWHFPFLSPGTSGNFLVAIMRWENGYRGK